MTQHGPRPSTTWDQINAGQGSATPGDPAGSRRASGWRDTAVTVGITPVELPDPRSDTRIRVTVQNRGTSSIFLGGASVSIASGIEIGSGETYELPLVDEGGRQIDVAVYAISSVAGQDVRVAELT